MEVSAFLSLLTQFPIFQTFSDFSEDAAFIYLLLKTVDYSLPIEFDWTFLKCDVHPEGTCIFLPFI